MWPIRNIAPDGSQFLILNTFHKGGTFSGDAQGESAFVPGNHSPGFQIVSPEHGVWQKTGAKTLAATFVAIEYNDDGSFYALFKVRFTGILNDSGDTMKIAAFSKEIGPKGDILSTNQATVDAERIGLEFELWLRQEWVWKDLVCEGLRPCCRPTHKRRSGKIGRDLSQHLPYDPCGGLQKILNGLKELFQKE